MKSEPGPPMTPQPQPKSGSLFGAASIRSTPTPARWLLATALKRPCSIGASGWSVPAEAAGGSIWW